MGLASTFEVYREDYELELECEECERAGGIILALTYCASPNEGENCIHSLHLYLSQSTIMMLRSAVTALLLAAPYVQATALTAMLGANEKACYYADVDGVGEKVGMLPLELA